MKESCGGRWSRAVVRVVVRVFLMTVQSSTAHTLGDPGLLKSQKSKTREIWEEITLWPVSVQWPQIRFTLKLDCDSHLGTVAGTWWVKEIWGERQLRSVDHFFETENHLELLLYTYYLAFWTLFGLRLVLELQPSMILPALYQLGSKGRLVPISKNNFCKISFSKTPGRWTSLHFAPWCLKQSTTSWPVTSKCKKRFHYTLVIDTSDKAPCVFSVFFKIQVFPFSIFLLQYYAFAPLSG